MSIYARVSDNHSGFGYLFGFWVSTGLVLVLNFYLNRSRFWFWVSTLGFGFGCTETPPDPNPTRCHPYTHPTVVRACLVGVLKFNRYCNIFILFGN